MYQFPAVLDKTTAVIGLNGSFRSGTATTAYIGKNFLIRKSNLQAGGNQVHFKHGRSPLT